jgi:Ser-tRNA(Ala) deacylase AlaX
LEINWDFRYKLMRMHTSAHVLGSIVCGKGALVSGNQLGFDETRFDFTFENFDRQVFDDAVKEANEALLKGIELRVYELPREEALKLPGVIKLASILPPEIAVWRIVEIPGVDLQADGGTHVRNTLEVGKIEITKLENKGARNKRVYYKLE